MTEQFDAPGNIVRVPVSYAQKLSPKVYDTLRFTDYQAVVVEKKEQEYVLEFDRDTLSSLLPKGHRFTVTAVQPVAATWVIVELREVWVQPVAVMVNVDPTMSHQEILEKAEVMAKEGQGENWSDKLEYSHPHDEHPVGDTYVAASSTEARPFIERTEKHIARRG